MVFAVAAVSVNRCRPVIYSAIVFSVCCSCSLPDTAYPVIAGARCGLLTPLVMIPIRVKLQTYNRLAPARAG